MPLSSMTGFASLAAETQGVSWTWEARSVNGRGFDLRLRLPEGFEGLEAGLRGAAGKAISRGTISIGLRFVRSASSGQIRVCPEGLAAAILSARAATEAASAHGLQLVPSSATALLEMRGVLDADDGGPSKNVESMDAIGAQIPELLEALVAARASEGAALAKLISERVDRISSLNDAARDAAEARAARSREALAARLEAILAATDHAVAPERLAQELALMAVKHDVSEELDRLDGHVVAARALLAETGPVGRKLDFLTQEFNREANTLCSKAQSADLTAIGLEMKVAIDQMREQVQNVE